jgi:hypothetical protein
MTLSRKKKKSTCKQSIILWGQAREEREFIFLSLETQEKARARG